MKIVVAPDSFKGSLSALQAAEAIEQGMGKVFPDANIKKFRWQMEAKAPPNRLLMQPAGNS